MPGGAWLTSPSQRFPSPDHQRRQDSQNCSRFAQYGGGWWLAYTGRTAAANSARSRSARLAGEFSPDAVVPVVTSSFVLVWACRAGQSCRQPRTHRGVRTAHVPADLRKGDACGGLQSSCSNVQRGRRPDARGAALRHRAAAPSRRRTGLLRTPPASTPDTAAGATRPVRPVHTSTARTADAATGAGRLERAVVAGVSDVAIRPRPRPVTAAGFSGLVGSSSPGCR